ncbi:restriction endonuclease subunit S [Clostridium sp. PL3]|uniref:Restriction endonuclease subunit S n=1 Tax=Clostridium thailandense TaxID=2794346 RepID=A0A949X430_9CLOT|nr:restriction endonuclease subunit S [Clostridium thailandense]MBV7275719.1 restriction endonuclease subunit S [Clostridium thailandense]
MSENKKNVPKRRFKEFENAEAWEQCKLNEIADVLDGDRGNNYPNGNEFQEIGHTLFLSASNVTTNGFMFDDTQYITEEKSNSMGNGKLLLNDIVLTSRGSIGHIAWYNKAIQQQVPFARINSGMLILRSKDFVMPCFVAQFLKSPLGKKQIDLISFGSAQPQLTKKDVSNYVVSIPSDSNEQRKLGVFFDNIDNLITLHQCKLEKMKALKKAYLMEMFPDERGCKPKLRFAGFTDDWEQRKVKDICSISTGKSNTQDKIENGEYPFYVRSPIIERSNRYLYDEEAVLTVGDGVGTGKVFHYVKGKYDLHQRVYRMFDFYNGVSGKYFYYYFSTHFYKRVMSMTAKTSVDSVRYEMISEMDIKYPSEQEQHQIVNVLEHLGDLITIHQRKLEKLQNIKKAYLNEMFI